MESLKRGPVRIAFLVYVLASLFHVDSLRADSINSLFHTIDSFAASQYIDMAAVDVDADGAEDAVFATNVRTTSVLFVVGKRQDGTIGFKQDIVLPFNNFAKHVVGASTPTGPVIVVITTAGIVRRYGGRPLAEQLAFDVGYTASAALGDVDVNGTLDLVVSGSSQLRTYSVQTGQLVRAMAGMNGYGSMVLAQMDADPALEIVLGGNVPGLIVDGATQAIDWTQPTSLGTELALGSIGTGGNNIIAAPTGWNTFGLFTGLPWSAYLNGSVAMGPVGGFEVTTLETAEGESVVASAASAFHVFDAANLQLRRSFSGCDFAGSVDFGNNGSRKLFCLSGLAVTIASAQTGGLEWRFDATGEPLMRSVIGDVDGDGLLELVAAGATRQGYGKRSLIISDLLTGAEKWRAPSAPLFTYDPLGLGAARVMLTPRPAAAGMNIVLAGDDGTNGQIVVIDGVNKNMTLSVGGSQPTSPFFGRFITDAASFDYDNDGVQDFVVGSSASHSGSQGAFLSVVSGVSGLQLWTSVPMGSGSPRVNNVLVLGRGEPDPELVAVLPTSLRSYDAQSGLLRWTWSINNNGAVLLPNSVSGDELLVYRTDGIVVVHAADTRQFLRSFSLPAPLSGLVALAANTRRLLAMHGERLTLVNSIDGAVVATTEPLGQAAEPAGSPAVYRITDSLWHVAVGTYSGLYRKLVVLDDVIFYGSFDGAP